MYLLEGKVELGYSGGGLVVCVGRGERGRWWHSMSTSAQL